MELIYSLNDTQAADIAISGGKGASLAKTIQALPVPDGLILSCEAYKQFISPLFGQISSLLAQHPDNEQNASESIRQLILSAPLPDSLTTLLSTRLHDSQLTHVPLAVRSSGTLEDMPGAAFAGQHDTILGVRDLPSLHDAIRQCYASLWHTHVMLYRQHLQLPHQHAAMAVVLQRMVDVRENEAAGVAFSIDPVRGNLSSVLINAAFGLGETVVGGEEPIDEYLMKEGAIISNTGHFEDEINLNALQELCVSTYEARQNIEAYCLKNGRTVYLLGRGALVNIACADGHPAEIMDMSFALQALGAEYLLKHALDKKVYAVSDEIDSEVARLKLQDMGVSFDTLSDRQYQYLNAFELK